MSALPLWPSIHPVLMRLSALLLLAAPLLILGGLLSAPPHRFRLLLAAFVAMALGTSGDYLAQGGVHAVVRAEPIKTTEFAFAALTFIFASIVFLPRLAKAKPTPVVSVLLPLVFLVFYAAGLVLLVDAAEDDGGSGAGAPPVILNLGQPGAK